MASNRLRTRYDIGTKQVLLQINDVRPQDIGEYLVIATNPAGEDSTVAPLSVVPDKPGVDDRAFVPPDKFRNLERPEGQAKRPLEIVPGADVQPEEKRPPRVLAPLSDSVLEESMPVLLTTTIDAGVPMATVRIHFYSFFRDSILIQSSSAERKILKYQLSIFTVGKLLDESIQNK
jgi:hypothetical protein